ncbi:MAG: DNA polymerase III subunit delta' [Betaproteobacteria bacterium]
MNIIELHSAVWEQLSARRAQLPHALLISGQRGIGKFELARRFAESLLCENPTQDSQACGTCAACGWQAQGNHPDFRLLQPDALAENEAEISEPAGKKKPSQQITIDQVRALDEFLHVGTHRQGARIVLINPAEAMNRATANSLLKSLEEPIASTLFILVSSEPDRLLPTIRSRCQSLPVPQPAFIKSEEWLRQAGVGDAPHWLALAGGSPLLAVELGSSDERVLLDAIIAELTQGRKIDPLAAAASVDRVIKAEKRPAALKGMVEWGQKWLYDLTLVSEGLPQRYFLSNSADLQRLVKSTHTANLLAFNRKTLQYRMQCEQPLNSRLFLEEFFLSYAAVFTVS